jgi:GNAT superfamily N-acetyltransferase
MTQLFSSADMALARRIEAGHAHSAMFSTRDLAVAEIAGGWAIFHAIDSPVTQAIGVGMNGPVESGDLDRLEAFYHGRGSAAIIDLCTLADESVLGLIHERGYTVREISNVLVRPLDPEEQFAIAPGVRVEPVTAHDYPAWARLVVQGFAGLDDVPEEQVAMMTSSIPWPETFFGFWDSAPGAGAAMDIHAGLATFFGDATLVQARGHGLQLALIRHRLQRAAQLECDLATASVVPGGTSHRNYERAGFQLVYGRVMLGRPLPGTEPSSTKNRAEGQRQ